MVSNETTGHLRDNHVINYLFKSVYELTDQDEDSYRQFGLQDVAILVDA